MLLTFVHYLLPLIVIDLPPSGVWCWYWRATRRLHGEAFRAGIQSLPQAQWNAARSLGISRRLMPRIVIFPQAMRLATPPFVNFCINLIKATLLRCVNILKDHQQRLVTVDGGPVGYGLDRSDARQCLSERDIAASREMIGIVFQSYNLFP